MSYISLIFFVLLIAVLIWQLLPFIRAKKMQGQSAPDIAALVNEQQKQHKQLLFYFWSPACGMCKNMTPIIDKLIESRDDVLSINVAEHLDIVRQFKIMGTPSLVIVKDGKIEKMILGVQSEKKINKLLHD